MKLSVKRVYEAPSSGDGFRVLVDRLWPRGLSKAKARIDLWLKDIAPSNELRKWFNHEADKWPEFQRRYREELALHPGAIEEFRAAAKGRSAVTLLYGAKDEEHNQAVALRLFLEES